MYPAVVLGRLQIHFIIWLWNVSLSGATALNRAFNPYSSWNRYEWNALLDQCYTDMCSRGQIHALAALTMALFWREHPCKPYPDPWISSALLPAGVPGAASGPARRRPCCEASGCERPPGHCAHPAASSAASPAAPRRAGARPGYASTASRSPTVSCSKGEQRHRPMGALLGV